MLQVQRVVNVSFVNETLGHRESLLTTWRIFGRKYPCFYFAGITIKGQLYILLTYGQGKPDEKYFAYYVVFRHKTKISGLSSYFHRLTGD
jgi:hypothetical protein